MKPGPSHLALLVATTGAMLYGTPVLAQEGDPPPPPDEQTSASAAEAEDSGEIVVTAQRREERLQDVPIAVSALNQAALSANGVTDTSDLTNAVPGLYMSRVNASVTPFIRGIGNKNTSPGDEGAAATYIDGVYISSLAGGLFAMNNIERVEVLRGPQGTLFGRNATAGVVQIITRDPSFSPSLEMSLGYGNYDTVEGTLYATTGITDNLAIDLAAYGRNQDEGFGTNFTTGNDAYLGHETAVRSKLLWRPGSDTRITFAIDYNRATPVAPPLFRALPGRQLRTGVGYGGFYNVFGGRDVFIDNEQWGANLQIRQDVGAVRLISITSYRAVDSFYFGENDGVPTVLAETDSSQFSKTWTQEFQIQSNSDSKLSWILGAYYYRDRSYYDPLIIQVGPNRTFRFSEQITNSYAGFAQATLEFLPRTNLTAGLRYTQDEREISGRDQNAAGIVTLTYPDQEASFGKLTWRLALDHHFNDDIMVYGSYSRGFKSGVFNTVAPGAPAVRPETVDAYELGLRSEFLDRRLRFNLTAFYNNFDEIQLQVPVVGGTQLLNAAAARTQGVELEVQFNPSPRLSISGSAAYLDSKFTSFPVSPGLVPQPGGGNLAVAVDATGNELQQAPHFTANLNASYRVPLSVGRLSFDGSFSHNSGFFFDTENRVRQPSYQLLNLGVSFEPTDRSWSLRLWGRNLTSARYYANIAPQTFGDMATPAAPLTYGATVTVRVQ